jgi:hypothetical protein
MDIKTEVEQIISRNKKVETDKAWETSWTRVIFLGGIIYLTAGAWLKILNDTYPWLKAFIPPLGFIVSTWSLPIIKKWWVKKNSNYL